MKRIQVTTNQIPIAVVVREREREKADEIKCTRRNNNEVKICFSVCSICYFLPTGYQLISEMPPTKLSVFTRQMMR